MIIVSTRKDFVDADKECENRITKEINLNNRNNISEENISDDKLIEKLTGDKILVVVHGYNNNFKKIIKTYKTVIKNLEAEYDHIIGFAWSGGDKFYDYFKAKKLINGVGKEFKEVLELLYNNNKKIDIMAHSLGNVLVFDAFKNDDTNIKMVRNFFSFAAAVDNNSLYKNGMYHRTTDNFENIYIGYSAKDAVTGPIRKTADWDFKHGAFGHVLPLDLEFFISKVENVHFVNCTKTISKHGAYKKSDEIYEFIRDIINYNIENFTFKNL